MEGGGRRVFGVAHRVPLKASLPLLAAACHLERAGQSRQGLARWAFQMGRARALNGQSKAGPGQVGLSNAAHCSAGPTLSAGLMQLATGI